MAAIHVKGRTGSSVLGRYIVVGSWLSLPMLSPEFPFDWVFFDLDGTLADSLGVMWDAYVHFLERFGVTPTQSEFDRLNGPSLPEIVALLKEWHGLLGSEADLLLAYQSGIAELYLARVKPMAGAIDLLLALKAGGVRLALVTSGVESLALPWVQHWGLDRLFEVMVFGDEVAHSKPDPAIYRLAMGRSGAENALVVEDSDNGVRSALAAGLAVARVGEVDGVGSSLWARVKAIRELWGLMTEEPRFRLLHQGRVSVQASPDPENLPENVQARVSEIWREELERRPGLFDGLLFRLTEILPLVQGNLGLRGYYSPYSQFLARLRDPGIGYDFMPLSVTGIVLAEGMILMAQRGNMTQYPHCWECVPSGGLDPEVVGNGPALDISAQLLVELQEETGIPSHWVDRVEPLGLIRNDESGVYCLAFALQLVSYRPALLSSAGGEYSGYEWVPVSRWENWVADKGEDIVPVSLALPQLCAEKGLI